MTNLVPHSSTHNNDLAGAEVVISTEKYWLYSMPEPQLMRTDDGVHVALVSQCVPDPCGGFTRESRITHSLQLTEDETRAIKAQHSSMSNAAFTVSFLNLIMSHTHVHIHRQCVSHFGADTHLPSRHVSDNLRQWQGEAYAAGYRVSMSFNGSWFYATDVPAPELDDLPYSGFSSETAAWEAAVIHFLLWTFARVKPYNRHIPTCANTNASSGPAAIGCAQERSQQSRSGLQHRLLFARPVITANPSWLKRLPEVQVVRLEDGQYLAIVGQCLLDTLGRLSEAGIISHTLKLTQDEYRRLKSMQSVKDEIRATVALLNFVYAHPGVVEHQTPDAARRDPEDPFLDLVTVALRRWQGEAYRSGFRVTINHDDSWSYFLKDDLGTVSDFSCCTFPSETAAWEAAVDQFLQLV